MTAVLHVHRASVGSIVPTVVSSGSAVGVSNRAFSRWIALQREPVTLEPVKIIGNMGGRQIAEKAGRPAAERGQFFVSFAVAEKLNERLRDLATDDPVEPLVRKWAGHLDRHQWDRAKATIEEIRATPSGEALAGPADATSLAAGSRIWAAVWKEYGKPGGSLPAMSVYATCAHYQGALRWDKQACMKTAERMGKKVQAAGGLRGSRSPATAFGETALAAGVRQESKPGGKGFVPGAKVTYAAGVGKQVARIVAAIDDGWLVHARVLSGAFGIGPGLDQPDHSVLIHSHVDGKVFDIADPDVGGSDVSGSGMGTLYFDGSRLTSFADDSNSTCEEHSGMQPDGEHRYQVMHVWTVGAAGNPAG